MAEPKTKKNAGNVMAFIEAVADQSKRNDCTMLLKLMKQVTGEKPVMWGDSIIGFGSFHYKSEKTKREGDWYITGFSPRKQNLTIYIIPGFGNYTELMKNLGKYKTSSGSCLTINKLADVDQQVLKQLIAQAYKDMKKKYQ
ncbi:MAG: DUF1801 domain-containing protein [Chitinophagaceae bacterium]